MTLVRSAHSRDEILPGMSRSSFLWCVLRFPDADNWIRAAAHEACRISYSMGETMPSDECRRPRLWEISRYSKIAFASSTRVFHRWRCDSSARRGRGPRVEPGRLGGVRRVRCVDLPGSDGRGRPYVLRLRRVRREWRRRVPALRSSCPRVAAIGPSPVHGRRGHRPRP